MARTRAANMLSSDMRRFLATASCSPGKKNCENSFDIQRFEISAECDSIDCLAINMCKIKKRAMCMLKNSSTYAYNTNVEDKY